MHRRPGQFALGPFIVMVTTDQVLMPRQKIEHSDGMRPIRFRLAAGKVAKNPKVIGRLDRLHTRHNRRVHVLDRGEGTRKKAANVIVTEVRVGGEVMRHHGLFQG